MTTTSAPVMQHPQPFRNSVAMALAMLLWTLLPLSNATAQISSGEGFLQGQYVEVGVNACGVFGGNNGPLTALGPGPLGPWHPNVGVGLGFVADADQDGWDVGFPDRCGDYFVPGSPEESWALQVGTGTVFRNAQLGCTTSDIPGSVSTYTDLGTARELVWEGDLISGGVNIGIKQTTVLPTDKLYFVTFVELTNNGAATVNDLYYGRSVDPDNEQPTSGDFTTTNTVLLQPPTDDDALVGAVGTDFGCFLGLGARDTDARAAIGSSGNHLCHDQPIRHLERRSRLRHLAWHRSSPTTGPSLWHSTSRKSFRANACPKALPTSSTRPTWPKHWMQPLPCASLPTALM